MSSVGDVPPANDRNLTRLLRGRASISLVASLLAACGGGEPTAVPPPGPPPPPPPPSVSLTEVETQVRGLFPDATEGQALDHIRDAEEDATANRGSQAEAHLMDFIELALAAFRGGELDTPPGASIPDALAALVGDAFALVRMDAPTFEAETVGPEGVAEVVAGGAETLTSSSGRVGVQLVSGTFASRSLLAITPLPAPAQPTEGPLPTNEPQYPPFYRVEASRTALRDYTAGVCVSTNPPSPTGAPVEILNRLSIARAESEGAEDTETWEDASVDFLDCLAVTPFLGPGISSSAAPSALFASTALGGRGSGFGIFGGVLAAGGGSGQINFVRAPSGSATDRDLWSVDFDGSNEMELSGDPLEDIWMAWSPDGSTLAFLRRDLGTGQRELWLMAPDGSAQRSLTAGGTWIGPSPPDWSPDGSQLVVSRTFLGPDRGLWIINADGSGERQITFGNIDLEPDWSPDGTSISFIRDDFGSDPDIWTINPDGTGAVNLTGDAASDGIRGSSFTGGPEWSPDATRIAWVSDLHGNDEIYVMDRDGSNRIRITDDPVADEYPVWSPTGLMLAYRHFEGGGDIRVVGADGTGMRVLNTFGTRPRWSPDGQWVAFCGGGVYVVGDSGGGLRQVTHTQGDCFIRWRP